MAGRFAGRVGGVSGRLARFAGGVAGFDGGLTGYARFADVPDLPDLHRMVILVVRGWSWSWNCCLEDYLVGVRVA